jgi:FMN-dependent NADH-azoreductase
VAEAFLKSADAYLISVPMWNFSIPYMLKHYIDIVIQPMDMGPERQRQKIEEAQAAAKKTGATL